MKISFIICLVQFVCFNSFGSTLYEFNKDSSNLPLVFVMDEDNEQLIDKLYEDYDVSLLNICGNNLELTGSKVVDFISEIENFASKMNFNINGIKFYYNVYFDKNGTIKHFAFMLRPESKNININSLISFFNTFIPNYKMQLPPKNKNKFSILGMSAYFPFYKGKVGNK